MCDAGARCVGGDDATGASAAAAACAGVGFGGRVGSDRGEVGDVADAGGDDDDDDDGGAFASPPLDRTLMPVNRLTISSSSSSSPSSLSASFLRSGLTGKLAFTGTAFPNPPLPCPR